jgi:methyl-accepting chemotaxis protein
MQNKLANIRIGKKLATAFGAVMLLVVTLYCLVIWAFHSVKTAVDQAEAETEKMLLAKEYFDDTARLTLYSATSVIRGKFSDDDIAHLAEIRASYGAVFDKLRARVDSASEGRRLMDLWNKQASLPRASNMRVAELNKAGRHAEAAKMFLDQSIPGHDEQDKTIQAFLRWQAGGLAESRRRSGHVISRAVSLISLVTLLVLTGCSLAAFVISRDITRPLQAAVSYVDRVAGGDISQDVRLPYLQRGDEIGVLAKAMQTMSTSFRGLIGNINQGIVVLSSSSADLSANSGRMSRGSREAFDKAHALAAAAEQTTANVISVASGMEQTSTNLHSVAAATEQMTSTIEEIASNSEQARRITGQATQQAASIMEQMNQLGQAANMIGKVTETISEISSQTNLLALNATIEAARAGSAGKGFAVVAGEIKDLATQTAAATEDIRTRIAGIQSSTRGGIDEIGKVTKVIREVNDIVASIAAAIEEQSTATKNIAANIGEASAGVRDANRRVAETSLATGEIAKDIVAVDQAAGQMAEGSEQVRSSAGALSKVAEQLQATIQRFKL